MPELPEIETIVRRLQNGTRTHPPLPGHVIQGVEVFWDRIVEEPDVVEFQEYVITKTIQNVRRRAKFIHIPLDQGHLICHLRMSGDLRMEPQHSPTGDPLPKQKYDQVILRLNSNWRLVFSSIRKFSRTYYVEDPQSVLGDLGPEPLGSDFNPQRLYEMLRAHSRQLKPLLMDQRFIAGLGNIYTDEALFRARLHPLRQSDSLSPAEATRLFQAIQAVLQEGIQAFGASLDWMYQGGSFQNVFRVHQREGEPCPECGTVIQRTTIGQRSTYYCPRCQRNPYSDDTAQ